MFSSMTDSLHKLIEDFEANYNENELNACEQLLQEFLIRFPREQLPNLMLEQYALGKTPSGSLSWWLEYNTISLGSIKGGSAAKHIIYFSRKDGDWKIPSGWDSVAEVWQKLRSDMVDLLNIYDHDSYSELNADSFMIRANMLKGKLLFMYRSDLFLPIYLLDHLQTFLTVLDVPKEQWAGKDGIQCNLLLNKTLRANELMEKWHPVKLKDFLYHTYLREHKYFKIAPGKDAFLWPECHKGGYICMGWDEMSNLTQYPDYDEFRNAFQKQAYQESMSKNTEKADELWKFYNLKTGDQVIVNKGKSQILAIGTVTSQGYEYKDDLESHKHVVFVQWDTIYEPPLDIPEQKYWPMKTVYELTKKQVLEWKKSNGVNKETGINPTPIYSQEDELLFSKLEQALMRKGQCILYGPPGTGKTFMARRYIEWKHTQLNLNQGQNVEICTFHPSFNYEDFIEGFKPIAGDNGTVAFQLEKGIFSSLCEKAQNSPETPYFLIIDELNRGNVPKIFGEIITLLEKDKRGMKLRLPQSKDNFSIPINLNIIATMNTSDRSIKMMDAALKRRFAFIECMPRYSLLESEIENLGLSLGTILKALNDALVKFQGRDKQIGHAYFMKNGQAISSLSDLKEVYELEVIPLIQEYCFDNYELLADIVGKGFVNAANMEIRSELFYEHNDAFAAELTKHFKG
ncbi:MAG: AAA family ATPase [Paenibacillus sp.]|nr:AAA family ATPase [Paenibacillus sp.]